MKKTFIVIVVAVVLIIAGILIFQGSKGKTTADSNDDSNSTTSARAPASPSPASTTVPGAIAILFYGDGCPHCEKMEQWLTENKVAEKVKFSNLEVWKDKENSKLLSEKAGICKIADDQVGVPFLFDTVNNKCFVGEVEVQNFFKSKI
jgi:glutaredoxin